MWFDNFDKFNKEKSGVVDRRLSQTLVRVQRKIYGFTMPISNFQENLMGYYFSNLCFKLFKAKGQLISKGHFCDTKMSFQN